MGSQSLVFFSFPGAVSFSCSSSSGPWKRKWFLRFHSPATIFFSFAPRAIKKKKERLERKEPIAATTADPNLYGFCGSIGESCGRHHSFLHARDQRKEEPSSSSFLRLKPERQAESLVRVAQEGFNLRDQCSALSFLSFLWRALE